LSEAKFHLGKNGPAPCKATVVACRYSAHGSEAEVQKLWEETQAEANPEHMRGISGSGKSSAQDEAERLAVLAYLGEESTYATTYEGSATVEELSVAAKLGPLTLSELSYEPAERDATFSSSSFSQTARYLFRDGSVAYYKHIGADKINSSEMSFYNTTPLGAAINEVNAYRMAKLLGPGYEDLVPETAFRKPYSYVGSIQRGVAEDENVARSFEANDELKADYRRAALFDFVIGSIDRHHGNYLYGVETVDGDQRSRLKLIDNSFSFPESDQEITYVLSVFANDEGTEDSNYGLDSVELTAEEIDAVERARAGVEKWLESGTIASDRGDATLKRIDFMLSTGQLQKLNEYDPRYSGDAYEEEPLPAL